jgi:hypothetical protein
MKYPPKYPRSLHWPESPTIHKDDKTHDNPESFVGREVVITEKLDGGNTTLWQGEVYARSTSQPSNAGWMGMVRKNHAWKTLNSPKCLVFCGEDLMGIHSIEYDAMKEEDTYKVFAIRFVPQEHQTGSDLFMSWDAVERLAAPYMLKTVPVLFRGTFNSINEITKWFDTELTKPSDIGPEREGFVIRWADGFKTSEFSQAVAKYVRPNHVQTDDKHWRVNWKTCKLK